MIIDMGTASEETQGTATTQVFDGGTGAKRL